MQEKYHENKDKSREYEKVKKQIQRLRKKLGTEFTKLYAKNIPYDVIKCENSKAYFNGFETRTPIQDFDGYILEFKSNTDAIKAL